MAFVNRVVIFVLAFLLLIGERALVGFGDSLPADGSFVERGGHASQLGAGTFTYCTADDLYASFNDGKDWKCVYVIPKPDQDNLGFDAGGGCVGGTASNIIVAVAHYPHRHSFPKGYTLVEWTAATGKLTDMGELPAFSKCRFSSDKVGAYAFENHVFITTDAAHTWHEVEFAKPPANGKVKAPSDKGVLGRFVDMTWISPMDLGVAFGSAVVSDRVGADGGIKELWRKDVASAPQLLAASDGDLWAITPNSSALLLKGADGSVAQTIRRYPSEMPVQNGRAYGIDPEGVSAYQMDAKGLNLVAAVKVPFAGKLLRTESGGVIIFTVDAEGSLFEWDGKAAKATLIHPKIDNSAIREADKPGPDQPTENEVNDFTALANKVGIPLTQRIANVALTQTAWSRRQDILWSTEQLKKADAQNGQWTPPATMPAADPSMAPIPHAAWGNWLGYSVGR